LPRLDRLLAGNRGLHGLVQLEPDTAMHVMVLGEPVAHVVLMLPNTRWKIGGDTDVQRAISLAGEEVDAWQTLAHGRKSIPSFDLPKRINEPTVIPAKAG